MEEEKRYAVLLTDHHEVKVIEQQPGEEVFDCGRRAIGCDWIELVNLTNFRKANLLMMIDEEGKIKDGEKYVNCVASYMYGTQAHGDPIIGNAVLIQSAGEDLVMMTKADAERMAERVSEMQKFAIPMISQRLHLIPAPAKGIRDDLQKKDPEKAVSPRRQRCNQDSMER